MPGLLEGKIVAVTGGASGIGEAACRLAAAEGASVAVLDIDEARADEVAADINAGSGTAKAWPLDVRDADNIESTIAAVEADLGPLDGMVASAGILQVPRGPEHTDLEVYDAVTAVNQRGVYLSCASAGKRMAVRGSGSIVTIASIAGMRAMPLHAYSPTKAAVISITQNLAVEWGRSGVRVNAVAPGFTLTPALQDAIDKGERDPSTISNNTALGRLVTAAEIADAVCFLLSDNATAITGITLPVDAGWLVAPSWHTYGGPPGPRGNHGAA